MQDTIVVVGGGHAAAQAVDSLRHAGFTGRLLLIGEEPALPYQRPPLSKKFLAGELPPDRLPIRPAAFYDSIRCEMRLGTTVTRLDAGAQELTLADGSRQRYDRLLLALGGHARALPVPGAGLAGVHTLRTLGDVEAIRAGLRPAARVAVVGAGYIGLECAATLRRLGHDVTVVEMQDRVMSRVVAPPVSEFYAAEHARQGVRILTGRRVGGFAGAGRVEAVECTDGSRVPADTVIVGIGLVPNTALAAEAGLDCDDGIAVDGHCRSSDPQIWAIGDCCSHPSPHYGRRIRLESVDNAFEQARTAAANLCGNALVHDKIPWFWSDQYELRMQIVGVSADGDTLVMRGDPATRSFSCCHLRDGALVALEAVNSPGDFMAARKLIAAGARPDPARLADAAIPLRETA